MNLKKGIISKDGKSATITFERRLSQPINKVWEAITDPGHREKWFGPTSLEPKEGGVIETVAEGPPAPEEIRRSKGKILTWDPPHIFEYKDESSNVGLTIVRFELTSENEGTNLRLINSGMKLSDAIGYAPGWHAFLERLTSHLDGTMLPDWGKVYRQVQPAYDDSED